MGGADENKIFDLVSIQNFSSISAVSADALTNPTKMVISHDDRKVNGTTVNGHLVRQTREFENSDSLPVELQCSIVLKVPQGITEVTVQEVENIVGRAAKVATDNALLAKLLNKEP